MDQEYSCRIKQILEEGRRCKERLGVMGPTGPTERLFKSSNKIIIDSS